MTPSSVCSSTVAPPEDDRTAVSSASALAVVAAGAQDLPAVETDLDPYEVVSHSQPPP